MKCVMILSSLLKSSSLLLILFLLIFSLRFLTRLLIVWFLGHSWTVQIWSLTFLITYIWRVNTKRLSWFLGLHLLLLRYVFFWDRYFFFVFLILLFFSLFLIFLRNSLRSFLLFLLVILRSFFHLFIRLLNSFILSIIFIIIVLGNFWLLCFCYYFLN